MGWIHIRVIAGDRDDDIIESGETGVGAARE